MKKKSMLIGTIVLMAVGFALATTNLIINSSVAVSNNGSDYDVKFTKVILEGTENNNLSKIMARK